MADGGQESAELRNQGIGMADYPVAQALITVGYGCRYSRGLLDDDGDQQKGEADE